MASLKNSFAELCSGCGTEPYDLRCTCGGKFSFSCTKKHAAKIREEFEFIKTNIEQRILQIEQPTQHEFTNVKTIVEDWVCINSLILLIF